MPSRTTNRTGVAALKKRGFATRAETPQTIRRAQLAPPLWIWAGGLLLALFVVFQIYGPALRGPFLFDDLALPFSSPLYPGKPLLGWLRGVRPLLMFTFWANYQISAENTFSYHVVNVLLHYANAILLFFIAGHLLKAGGTANAKSNLLAGFVAALFLVHPIQAESVAYIAGRSESLSALLFLGAFLVFLHHRTPFITWKASFAVIVLFAAAVAAKEQALTLPALLVLTDYFWTTPFSWRGVARNWRLYAPVVGASALAAIAVWKVLAASISAGFGLKDMTWSQYFFTECRVIPIYIRLFFFPFRQTIDHDVPVSQSFLDHGAGFGLAGIVVLIAAAILLRRRAPLACFGVLCFFLLLAPTSSFIPLRDPIAEHRLYLPAIGLLFVIADLLGRLRVKERPLIWSLAAILVLAGCLTWQRSRVWSSNTALAEDAVEKSPHKTRPYVFLSSAYMRKGRCADLERRLTSSASLVTLDYNYLLSWGMADDCVHDVPGALAKFKRAAGIQETGWVLALKGMAEAKMGRAQDALNDFNRAIVIAPNADVPYVYRGYWHVAARQWTEAVNDFNRALEINPVNEQALRGLRQIESMPAAAR